MLLALADRWDIILPPGRCYIMAIFRRGQAKCSCGKLKRIELDTTAKHSNAKCSCGKTLKIELDPAWWVGYRDPEGKYRRKKVGSKRAAQAIEAKLRIDIVEGKFIEKPKAHTLGELGKEYLAYLEPRRHQDNFQKEKSRIKTVFRYFGYQTRIDKITSADIEDFRTFQLSQGKSNTTINRQLISFGASLSWALNRGWIHNRPKIKQTVIPDSEPRFITKPEARVLLASCGPELTDYVLAALATGMRQGELLAMRWNWISLEARVINIPGSATKTLRARPVPINDELMLLLRKNRDKEYPLGKTWKHNTRLKDLFRAAREKAGFPGLRFHDLRHSAASWMVQAGIDLYQVAQVLGHKNLRITQRYARFAPKHLQAAVIHTNFQSPD